MQLFLNPLKEQLDLLTLLIEHGDRFGGQFEVIGQKDQPPVAFGVQKSNPPQPFGKFFARHDPGRRNRQIACTPFFVSTGFEARRRKSEFSLARVTKNAHIVKTPVWYEYCGRQIAAQIQWRVHFDGALARRNEAHGNRVRRRSIIVESNA